MSDTTRTGLRALAAGLALGALGDGLLRAVPMGLNAAVWTVALVAAVLWVRPWNRRDAWLLAMAVVFAAMLAWRDAPALKTLNISAALVALALGLPRPSNESLWRAGFLEHAGRLLQASQYAMVGAGMLAFHEIRWEETPRGRHGTLLAVVRGILVALPILLLFGALFAAADAVFQDLANRLFHWNFDALWSHFLLFTAFAWTSAGYLRGTAFRPEEARTADDSPEPDAPAPGAVRSFTVEGAMVLGLVNLLFLAFVAVQVRYLFGGGAYYASRAGLTYAQYARSGFFELVAVAALCLPLLLIAHTTMRAERPGSRRLYGALSGAMVVLLFVIIASGLKRMSLYMEAYGLTELRVYATAFMIWLGVVFAWFLTTVAAGRRGPFAFGAVAAAGIALLGLNALNPDALIARVNTSRLNATVLMDTGYLASLSADAVPTLLDNLPTLTPGAQRSLSRRLLDREVEEGDWRTWNLSRTLARATLRIEKESLLELARLPTDERLRRETNPGQ